MQPAFSQPYNSTAIPPIDFKAALNDDQYRAVTAGDGPALVLAGAGSGKTRTLTYRVAWLLSQGVRPWEILLLTFTNKAAREMLTRVEDLTSIPRTEFWGGTFHSIGQRFLRYHAARADRTPSFTILDADDADSLFNKLAKSANAAFFKSKEAPKPGVILNAISYTRNTRKTYKEIFTERFDWLPEESISTLVAFAEAYRITKKELNVCDYDDLLELWLHVLENYPEVRQYQQQRFRHILVDEFQDTNKLQSDIVDILAGNHQLMAVGDDAQCIYTWRGAEFANVAEFRQRHPGAAIHKIEINYRSTPEILNFANGILASQTGASGFSKILRPVRPQGTRPWLVPALDASEQATLVVRCVLGLLERGRELHDITVLYRAHYQAMELQMELSRQNIPFVITSGVRFFDQAHIRDIVAHLRFVHNPSDTVAFTRLMELLPKTGPRTADKILETARNVAQRSGIRFLAALDSEKTLAKVPENAREDFISLVQTLRDMDAAAFGPQGPPPPLSPGDLQIPFVQYEDGFFGGEKNTTPAATPIPMRTDLFDGLPENDDDADNNGNKTVAIVPARTTANAAAATQIRKTPEEVVRIAIEGWYGDHIKLIYSNWEERRDDLDNLRSFASKHEDMAEFLSQLVLLSSEAGDKAADPDASVLRLTTIHQAKGLEFPVVLVLGCADELFPLKRAIERGDISEERRLFYVASTRAMDELYLFYPKLTRSGGPPRLLQLSRFIQDLPSDTYEVVYVRGN